MIQKQAEEHRMKENNKLAEDFWVSGLRITEVHHFIEELVNDNKVIANTLLAHFTEVLLKNVDELVEEEQCHGTINIAVSDSKNCSPTRKKKKKKKVRKHI